MKAFLKVAKNTHMLATILDYTWQPANPFVTLLRSADNTFHEANNSTEPYRFEPESIDKELVFPPSNKQSVKWSEQEICFPP